MLLPLLSVVGGLVVLVWAADRFVSGAAGVAAHRGMSPLFVGMVIVGFGTSAPEITVSAFAALGGASELALGNAWGSNIFNIGLILGLTAVISPIAVRSGVIRREIPVLIAVTLLTILLASDLSMSRIDAVILLIAFAAFLGWQIRASSGEDALAEEVETSEMTERRAWLWTLVGLGLLVVSSRVLVWGAVDLARLLGVSDLVIGLTVVAAGTSLPELASSLAAVRRGAHDIALGNVIGSNLFNSLAVVGIAMAIEPAGLAPVVLWRDLGVMTVLTLLLLPIGWPWRRGRQGRVNRVEGGCLLAIWAGYTAWLVRGAVLASA